MNEAIRELGQQLSSEDPYDRASSALELAELEDPEAAPFLVQALEDEEDPVRRWAAYGLAKLGRPEHAPSLRHSLEKDPDPRVRVQAAFGLARLREKGALEKLAQYLGAPLLEVRREAAAMLVLLPDPSSVRPLLKPLLTARDERSRAWAAGLLHAMGESEAFPKWRSALASPEGRRDAVLAVQLMHETRAVREVVRLLAELSQEELDTAEEEESSLLVVLCEALRLAGLELLLSTDTDEALRSDLLVVLGRHRPFIPDLVDSIVGAFAQRPPDKLGRELAQFLLKRESAERAQFFTNVASLFSNAALPTLAELKGQEREALLLAVVEMAKAAEGTDPDLLAICEVLRATPYGHHFEGLPTEPITSEQEFPEGEDDLDGETQEMAIPEDEGPLGEDEDAESWTEQMPPEEEAVAQRALVLGGLLRRLSLEERLGKVKDPAAKEEILRLQRWMDEEGLFSTLGVADIALLEAAPGTWIPDHRLSVAWLAEELQWLLWGLKQVKPPPVDARVEPAPLLDLLPLLKDPQPFLESADRRPLEEMEAERSRWELVLECARHESFARGIAADPTIAEGDPDLAMLLESAEEVGFDRKSVSANQGKTQAVVEGLRHWARHVATELQQQGLLPGKPGEGLVFQGKQLHELDANALTLLLSLAYSRAQALEWLVAGGAALPDGEEEVG